ncbi:MAG TPA: hypothetical protein DCX92_08835, partial [Bacteroidetes bacterium]|nr:hypothetical protein [Bacteroidota bacterium]
MFGQEPTERIRTYDVQHIKLEISVDPEAKTVSGLVYTSIVPIENGFSEFEVDAAGMTIESVWLDTKGPMTISYDG